MKKVILLLIVFISANCFASPVNYILPALNFSTEKATVKKELSKEQLLKMTALKIKDVEKLTIKEKVAFKILQKKIKNQYYPGEEPGSNKGKTALILSIIALAFIFVPYAVIASIPLAIIAIVMGNKAKNINREDKKAKTAVVLGWIALGLIVLFITLAAIIVAAYGGFF